MENIKIISDNGIETIVNGLFYVFNSKYYFIYTIGEIEDSQYVKLYVVQVCKEVTNTPNGPVDTGYMLGMEISNPDEWAKVQESIKNIVEDKKNDVQNTEIQYLPIDMIVNLKIVSKNKFKLMKHIIENNFKIILPPEVSSTTTKNIIDSYINDLDSDNEIGLNQNEQGINNHLNIIGEQKNINIESNRENLGEVIIDYRARFFEEQEKNQALEEQIKKLNQKLEDIKNIIG